ncbi:MAG: 30S ribosomal protein S12 methylthiotransferase RimO [Actinobacteria bacterium]|nr:30S ribosomal protein S12 methylthiotransferase RimO [Actinomycetota bacterium]MCB9388142.1 30S ribosomal protein S12 methylthiotransferase RimO [Acidimicrobiia bacterium]
MSESSQPPRVYLATLGCPKNAVDSSKVAGSLSDDGYVSTDDPAQADLVVVNTCAFIEAARQESIDTVLELADQRRAGAQLVVTGCMAERYGDEIRDAIPEVDAVVGFLGEGDIAAAVERGAGLASGSRPSSPGLSGVGVQGTGLAGAGASTGSDPVAVTLRPKPVGVRDLLELRRPADGASWAYVKVAEGCDRACAFCAIPSFRGKQRSRTIDSIVAECLELVAAGTKEIVLVAQDLAWFGRDRDEGQNLAQLLGRLETLMPLGLARVRLLYLYPSEVRGELLDVMTTSPLVVPYFDLSLQHASAPLLRRMKRWGDGERFVDMIADLRRRTDGRAVIRSSFIVGFPGETEADHDQLLDFLDATCIEWAGLFAYSREDGTAAADLDGAIPDELVAERLRELSERQDAITADARHRLVGTTSTLLLDELDPGSGIAVGRTYREAPEIDGIVSLVLDDASDPLTSSGDPGRLAPGDLVQVLIDGVEGPDLTARLCKGTAISPPPPSSHRHRSSTGVDPAGLNAGGG